MKHGIVILTHNQSSQLDCSLFYLNLQTVLPDIVVIIDNASDEVYNINYIKYPNLNIKYIKLIEKELAPNRSRARNIGYELCDTDIITFLDGDILVALDYAENTQKLLAKFPQALFVGLRKAIDSKHFDLYSIFTSQRLFLEDELWLTNEDVLKKIEFTYVYSANISFIKNKDMGKPFDENFFGWGFEDTELGYRYYINGYDLFRSGLLKCVHIEHGSVFFTEEKRIERDNNLQYFLKKYNYDPYLLEEYKKFEKNSLEVPAPTTFINLF